jgi:hypothetical protein
VETEEEDGKLKNSVQLHWDKYKIEIGLQLPRWFRVEQKYSASRDVMISFSTASTGRLEILLLHG